MQKDVLITMTFVSHYSSAYLAKTNTVTPAMTAEDEF